MKEVASKLSDWREHPSQMVREMFGVNPDPWQEEALEAFPRNPRLAMKACAGPGKTSCLAWMGWNFLLTRPHPIIGATSITGDNLRANLWTELARWREEAPILKQLFEMTKTEIYARDHPKTWKIEARTWAKDADATAIGNALRGLHAKYVMWLLDESGDYPNAVLPVCENIFSGSPIEAHIVQAGNPTQIDGPLYRACTIARRLWYVVQITGDPDNPARSPRISLDHAREQIEQYGRDNPWVMINILGEFPPAAINALIGPDEVETAMNRYYRDFEIGDAPKILGVDVAQEGDDASVIFKRHGLQSFPIRKFRNIDSTQGAAAVSREWDDWGADATFVDSTGGFGSGWIDQLRLFGRQPIGVNFSSTAAAKERYFNKRAEMYFEAVEWIKRGGALPKEPEIVAALTRTTYTHRGGRLLLEPKKLVKIKLGYSPDVTDAFVLTFAEPVAHRASLRRINRQAQTDYNAFGELERQVRQSYGQDYDPFR